MSTQANPIPDWAVNAARQAYDDSPIKVIGGLESGALIQHFAKAIHDAVMAERERIILLISEQASALAEAAIYGLAENARSREAMEAALTKFSHIIRVAALPATPKAEG